MQNNSTATTPDSSGPPPVLILFVVLLVVGIMGYMFFSKSTPAPAAAAPAKGSTAGSGAAPCVPDGLDDSGQPINAGGYLIDANCKLLTDAKGEPILGAGVAG